MISLWPEPTNDLFDPTPVFDPAQIVGPPVAGPSQNFPPVSPGGGGGTGATIVGVTGPVNLLSLNPGPIDAISSPGGSGSGNGVSGPGMTVVALAPVAAAGKTINNLSGGSKVFLGVIVVAALLYLL